MFTIYGALHPKSDVDRLYIPTKEGGLEVYVHRSEERLTQVARGDKIDSLEAASVLKRSKKEKRLEDWEEKVLHGQYLRQTKEVRSDHCWAWLQNRDLKRETKSYCGSSESEHNNKSS